MLAIVRSIQIKYPFYPVRKTLVLLGLAALIVSQLAIGIFHSNSPLCEKRFYPAFLSAVGRNPFGLDESNFKRVQTISAYILYLPLCIVQMLAVFASVMTAITLLQHRNSDNASTLPKNRTAGAIKVLLTNVFSLLYALLLGTPLLSFLYKAHYRGSVSEKEGWTMLLCPVMFPLLSSIWNPSVFIFLTPKSRKHLNFNF
jgi:uncharacterized membrane protein YjgN (DUF898 family)